MDFGSRNHGHGRIPSVDSDHEMPMHARRPSAPQSLGRRLSRRKESMQHAHPKPPLTPNSTSIPQSMANPLLPSAPTSPPTPAPSPTLHQRSPTAWPPSLDDTEDSITEEARHVFGRLNTAAKENWLRSLVEMCDNHSLSFLHQIISPRLKKDPFKALPPEMCYKVCRIAAENRTILWLTVLRYSNSLMTPRLSSAPLRFQGGGVRYLAMTKPGKNCARSMRTEGCLLIPSGRV